LVELVWDRKYDKNNSKIAPVSISLPFQTIETVNESSIQRQKSIESFLKDDSEIIWRNRLIWGDKKYVLPSLLTEFSNSVDLIYIDPPFDTGADFSYRVEMPDHGQSTTSFTKLPSIIEQKAYRDTWGEGPTHLESYLHWFHDTLLFLEKLLKPNGSIYVHLDWHIVHYAKVILDEVFGRDNFRNEIIWKRTTAHGDTKQGAKRFSIVHDSILFYSKSLDYNWIPQFLAFTDEQIEQQYSKTDSSGRRYRLVTPTAAKPGGDTSYEFHGVRPPKGRYWAYTKAKMEKMYANGVLYFSSTGQPYIKYYLDERPGVIPSTLWVDIPQMAPTSKERTGFPTQKPETLLERIINTSSRPGDLVLDCFVGSGTTPVVAEKTGRRWIACDLSRFAIHTTRKRLLGVQGVKPFVIQNLGKYERQAWQNAEFGNEYYAKIRAYRHFMLKLYNAQPLRGLIWLHGKKGNRFVHVGPISSPISVSDVENIVKELKKSMGNGNAKLKICDVGVLGWDFAFELNEIAKQQAAKENVNVRFLRIPREVLDKKAVEQGDVHFFELASLDVRVKKTGLKVNIGINDFVIPADDVPADIQKEITHWSQWIDYWAIDWNNKDDTFHNEWQEYRTREKPELLTESSKTYKSHGDYRVLVKVIDILGNDTTKSLRVNV